MSRRKCICLATFNDNMLKGDISEYWFSKDTGQYLIFKQGYTMIITENTFRYYFEEVKNNMSKELIQAELSKLEGSCKNMSEQIDTYKASIDELKIQLDNFKESKVWKPTYGDKYWYYTTTGNTFRTSWCDNESDEAHYELGNCFKTRQEVERVVFELKLQTKLKRFALEYNEEEIAWNDKNQAKFYIYYSNSEQELEYNYVYTGKMYGIIYFISKEIVERAIEEFKDDLIRYFTTNE